MFTYNYHCHTKRCGHASGTDEEYVEAAIKAGYKVLGFSDHGPYSLYPHPGSHMDWSQLDDYINSINSLKEKYKGIIDIKLGIESEYYPFCLEERRQMRKRLDYMIFGQHYDQALGLGV
ncbi:MAG: PHP domain-containing protein, partial [Erysipelotrichaceae bacterium]|nr:PHP domain-containing protein [Erysipelotrichaceae bacterium]